MGSIRETFHVSISGAALKSVSKFKREGRLNGHAYRYAIRSRSTIKVSMIGTCQEGPKRVLSRNGRMCSWGWEAYIADHFGIFVERGTDFDKSPHVFMQTHV